MRKALIAFMAFAAVFIASGAAVADEVIIDRLSQSEAEALNLDIPDDVPPGFHVVEVEISDDSGIVETKELAFCKNEDGSISWANSCPALKVDQATQPQDQSQSVTFEAAEETVGLTIAALALLSVLGIRRERDEEREQGELSSIDSGDLRAFDGIQGVGDRSITWRTFGTSWLDKASVDAAVRLSRRSTLLSRAISDGTYLRAMIGSTSLLAYVLGLVLAVLILIQVDAQALPPSYVLLLLVMALGVFDALAGMLVAFIYFAGVAIAGGITNLDSALTVLGVSVIFFAPALLASSIRPIRRRITDMDLAWERVTDYALAVLLAGWAVSKMVSALNGLSGQDLAITAQASAIGVWAGLLIAVRYLLEDIATYLYPYRTLLLTPNSSEPTMLMQHVSVVVKATVFALVALPFVGPNTQLLVGTLLFIVPALLSLNVGQRLPQSQLVQRVMPNGALKIVVLVFLAGTFTAWVKGLFDDPDLYVAWAFVLAAIPGLFFTVAGWVSAPSDLAWRENSVGRWVYRVAGVAVFTVLVQIVRGTDIVAVTKDLLSL